MFPDAILRPNGLGNSHALSILKQNLLDEDRVLISGMAASVCVPSCNQSSEARGESLVNGTLPCQRPNMVFNNLPIY